MSQPYSEAFYEGQQTGSVGSAEIVVPLVLSLFPARSVVDVGCGVGGWLKEFERRGVTDLLGIDGDYLPRHLLKIPSDKFMPYDLAELEDVGRRFDLACSLEVAEHLPERCAERFVSVLVKAAPVVLFSAAIPGQGGRDHINERWQSYWAGLFDRHGYVGVDCIRPSIFHHEGVKWWYRQNLLVFCEPDRRPPHIAPVTGAYDLDRVHPGLLADLCGRIESGPHSGKAAAKQALRNFGVIGRAALRRAGRTG